MATLLPGVDVVDAKITVCDSPILVAKKTIRLNIRVELHGAHLAANPGGKTDTLSRTLTG